METLVQNVYPQRGTQVRIHKKNIAFFPAHQIVGASGQVSKIFPTRGRFNPVNTYNVEMPETEGRRGPVKVVFLKDETGTVTYEITSPVVTETLSSTSLASI